MTRPLFIGLAGPSGSGKSSLARALQISLGEGTCGLISLDSYYRDLGHLSLEEREKTDFDHPAALDSGRLTADVRKLKSGEEIEIPVYDFSTHARRPEACPFAPKPLILLEGIFVLCLPGVKELLDLSLYVALDGDACLARRLARDVHERGRDEAGIRGQFEQWVRPSLKTWVEPQKDLADIVLDGTLPVSDLAARALPGIHLLRGTLTENL